MAFSLLRGGGFLDIVSLTTVLIQGLVGNLTITITNTKIKEMSFRKIATRLCRGLFLGRTRRARMTAAGTAVSSEIVAIYSESTPMDLVRNEDKKKMFELSAKVFLTKLALVPKLISLSLPLSLVWSSPGVANCTPLVGFSAAYYAVACGTATAVSIAVSRLIWNRDLSLNK
ncbi:hypothetical protein DL95DRAFT_400496 [Leptodontidium sp. 2 PMI_412]|nr:hypothetical protein DL95DRAFT_400496 [Leptodontidium sp. 2 PMI_412]